MRWFFRDTNTKDHKDHDDNDFFYLARSSLQSVIIGMIIIFLGVFISGYYWGKKSALEQFMKDLDQESFADKIYTSMCSWEDEPKEKEDMASEETPSLANVDDGDVQSTERLFVAQLAGFGWQKAAQAYQLRLQKKGVPVHVVERNSVTAQGKKRVWYQVVTPALEKTMIDDIVKRLVQEDKLTSVEIVEVNNNYSTHGT